MWFIRRVQAASSENLFDNLPPTQTPLQGTPICEPGHLVLFSFHYFASVLLCVCLWTSWQHNTLTSWTKSPGGCQQFPVQEEVDLVDADHHLVVLRPHRARNHRSLISKTPGVWDPLNLLHFSTLGSFAVKENLPFGGRRGVCSVDCWKKNFFRTQFLDKGWKTRGLHQDSRWN